jgi:hypothetical protein
MEKISKESAKACRFGAGAEQKFYSPTSRTSSVHILPRCKRRRKLGAGGCSPSNSADHVFHKISLALATVVSSGNERVRLCPDTRRNVSVICGSGRLGEGVSGAAGTGPSGEAGARVIASIDGRGGKMVALERIAATRGDTCVVSWILAADVRASDAAEGDAAVSWGRPSWVSVVVVWGIVIGMCTFVLIARH